MWVGTHATMRIETINVRGVDGIFGRARKLHYIKIKNLDIVILTEKQAQQYKEKL